LRTKKVRTDRQTDRHTPMTTRPCGLRRAGNKLKNFEKVCGKLVAVDDGVKTA